MNENEVRPLETKIEPKNLGKELINHEPSIDPPLDEVRIYENTLFFAENRASNLFNSICVVLVLGAVVGFVFIPDIQEYIYGKARYEISYLTIGAVIVSIVSIIALALYFLVNSKVISIKHKLSRLYIHKVKSGEDIDEIMREKLFGGSFFQLPQYHYFPQKVQVVMLKTHLVRLQTLGSRLWTIAIVIIVGIILNGFTSSIRFGSDLYEVWIRAILPAIGYASAVFAIASFLYLTLIWYGKRVTRAQLDEIRERIYLENAKDKEKRKGDLQDDLYRLAKKTQIVFSENENGRNSAQESLKEARDILEDQESPDWSQIQTLLGTINELILREEKEQREQKNWRTLAIFIILLYMAGIVVAIILIPSKSANEPIPILGVPPSIIIWSAIGSLAAILYKFFTQEGRIQLSEQVRWLIGRPIIGIIMGSVAYLVFSSGLVLFNAQPTSNDPGNTTLGLAVFYTLAFVAGFSDRFYLSIINLLIEKAPFGQKESEEEETGKKPDGQSPVQNKTTDTVSPADQSETAQGEPPAE